MIGPFEECPLLVIYGTISDGFQFYGPFRDDREVAVFVTRLGLANKYVEIKILDIPTH